jgi:hypothetical protein
MLSSLRAMVRICSEGMASMVWISVLLSYLLVWLYFLEMSLREFVSARTDSVLSF